MDHDGGAGAQDVDEAEMDPLQVSVNKWEIMMESALTSVEEQTSAVHAELQVRSFAPQGLYLSSRSESLSEILEILRTLEREVLDTTFGGIACASERFDIGRRSSVNEVAHQIKASIDSHARDSSCMHETQNANESHGKDTLDKIPEPLWSDVDRALAQHHGTRELLDYFAAPAKMERPARGVYEPEETFSSPSDFEIEEITYHDRKLSRDHGEASPRTALPRAHMMTAAHVQASLGVEDMLSYGQEGNEEERRREALCWSRNGLPHAKLMSLFPPGIGASEAISSLLAELIDAQRQAAAEEGALRAEKQACELLISEQNEGGSQDDPESFLFQELIDTWGRMTTHAAKFTLLKGRAIKFLDGASKALMGVQDHAKRATHAAGAYLSCLQEVCMQYSGESL